jgi:GntR family transcriptional regulator
MALWFDIDSKSGTPIFKQVIGQVKRAVATGMVLPDEQLPTVRELAEEHSLNPNTIAKAYQNLEILGIVYTRPGPRGGTFIAATAAAGVREEELDRFQEELRKLVRYGHSLGLETAELEKRFQFELMAWFNGHPLPAPASIEMPADRPARKLYSSKE